MSLENIQDRIISEAEKVRELALKDAESEAEKILERARTEAEQILAGAASRGEAEKEKILRRGESLVNVDRRKTILAKKQELVQAAFAEAGVDFEENKRELLGEAAKLLF